MFSTKVISESGYELMVLIITIVLALLPLFRKLRNKGKLTFSDKISFYGLWALLLISCGMILSKNEGVIKDREALTEELRNLKNGQTEESQKAQNRFESQLKQSQESEVKTSNELIRIREIIERSGLEYNPTTGTYVSRWKLTKTDKKRIDEQFEYCNEFHLIRYSNSENAIYFSEQIKDYLISKGKKVDGPDYVMYNSDKGVPSNFIFAPNCIIIVGERRQ